MDFQPSSETLQNSLSCCSCWESNSLQTIYYHKNTKRKVLNDLFLQTACSTINLLALYPVIKAPTQPWQFMKNFTAAWLTPLWETVKQHVVFLLMLSLRLFNR